MNTKQLEYALTLAQTRNFSQAAAKLNMSQPTLSKQIRALEEELGVQLFDRSSVPLTLTGAGECFIQEVRDMLQKENRLRSLMSNFKDGNRGRLVIGISPFRCSYLIPGIVRKLRDEFPGLQIILKEAGSTELHRGASEGDFDLTIMNLPVDEALLSTRLLKPESLMIAIPERFLSEVPSDTDTLSLAQCNNIPFVVLSGRQELRLLFDSICAASGVQPQIAAEVVGILSSWSLAKAGVGAVLLPNSFVESQPEVKKIRFLKLTQDTLFRRPVVAYRKDRTLSAYARRALELLTNE